jgi:signal transduction histidine kinase
MDAADLHQPRAVTRNYETWRWALAFCVMGLCLATIAALLLPNNRAGNAPLVAAALAGIIVCLAVGGPVFLSEEPTWRAWLLVGVAAALALVAITFSPVTTATVPVAIASVPIIYPIIFGSLPIRTATVVTVAVTATPMLIVLIAGRPISENIPLVVFIDLLAMIAGPVTGRFGAMMVQQRAELGAAVRELAASRAESARLSSEAGAAAERERMATEIHDTLAQGFTSIVALSQAVEAELVSDPAAANRHLELIQTTARENLAEARVIVAGLTPTALGEGSLVAAIRRLCDKLTAESGISVSMSSDRNLPALGMAADVVLLRAAQEALANIGKHAHASAVCAELSVTDNAVRLVLADNGVGLAGEHPEGFGLRGMQARVAQVGGTVAVSRTPGGGVTLEIQVPT